MVTVKLMGGMGNQMHIYAMGLAQARRLNTTLQLDISLLGGKRKYVLDQWNVSESTVTGVTPTIFEPGNMVYSQELVDRIKDGDCLQGYWQSDKYFQEIALDLMCVFIPKTSNDRVKSLMGSVIRKNNSVALHIRRDDYLVSPHKEFHGLLGMDYYQKAMGYITERFRDSHFFIFCEDVQWAQANFGGDRITVIEPGLEAHDIYLISLCQHAIVANSSFSWWGARLGDCYTNRVVIAPKEWFKDPHASYKDLVPERWIRL